MQGKKTSREEEEGRLAGETQVTWPRSRPKNVVAEVAWTIPKLQDGPQTVAGTIAKLRPAVEYERVSPEQLLNRFITPMEYQMD
jgi:hypothetical protein